MCIGLCALLLAFVFYNIFWATYVHCRFDPLTQNIPQKNDSILLSLDGISYSVSKPDYLRLTGNLSVIDENTHEGILIWPSFPSGYTYAAVLITGVDESTGSEIPAISIIQIDENGEWADNSGVFGEKEKAVVRKRQADIREYIRLADEMWHLAHETSE